MIIEPKVEDLLEKTGTRYELAIVASKRARQLVDGSEPKVKTKTKSKVTIASLEILEGQCYKIKN